MKRKLMLSVLLASATGAIGQTYWNSGLVECPPHIPPNIHAQAFINSGQFIVNFTNNLLGSFYSPTLGPVYETQDTQYYTNQFGALLSCNSGFRFAYFDAGAGKLLPSTVFHNEGDIHAGTIETTNFSVYLADAWNITGTTQFAFGTIAGARCTILADNIINHGNIDLGFDSLLTVDGGSVDLSRGGLAEDNTGFVFAGSSNVDLSFDNGIFDGYWGIGDPVTQRPLYYPNGINPNFYFDSANPQTPFHDVTTRQGPTLIQSLGGPTFQSYISDISNPAASNRFVRIVFLSNTNADLQANVYFPPAGDIVVEYTNLTHETAENLYIEDDFGIVTNFSLIADAIAGYRLITYIPEDYFIFQSVPLDFGPPAGITTIPPGTFFPGAVTNQWQAYEALFNPLSYITEDIYGRDITNGPGRIEIAAKEVLDLSHSQINSENYLNLVATNHFISPEGTAQIFSPTIDLNLRSTNGFFALTNIISPQVDRYEGKIDLFSARWTNVVAGITNVYHVLFDDSQISPSAPERSQDVLLRVTNYVGASDSLIINDQITVSRKLLLDADRITIATNEPDADSVAGGIAITEPGIIWPNSAPRVQFFTNNGTFSAVNTVFFGGLANSPYDPVGTRPYQVFENTGTITNFSSQIQANLFENIGGAVVSYGGNLTLESQTAILTNGYFLATNNSVNITADSLQISNEVVQAGGSLNIQATTVLDDGSLNPVGVDSADFVTNKNVWASGNGLNLLQVPVGNASLLATTITNTAPAFRAVMNRSAAQDLGNSPNGFNKNAAVGRLVLDGAQNSVFVFSPVTGNNALYVDEIDLEDYTTNYNTSGNFVGLQVNPGMKVYFANATANGQIIADKLNGANNGGFVWVSNYNCGFFSSTNMVYPDGSTNRVNLALATDCNVDSDGDSIVNCTDPDPIPPSTLAVCTPAPFPPASIPVPAITAGESDGGSSAGQSDSAVSNPKLGFRPTNGDTASPALLTGVYYGLFSDRSNGVASASSGYLTVTEKARGIFTAKLILNGHTYNASGMFGHSGTASSVRFHSGHFPAITGSLQLDSTGTEITGHLTSGTWTADVIADRLAFTKKKGSMASDYAGTYTLRIPAGDAGPLGDSFGMVTIDNSGSVRWTGAMADGSKVSQKTSISDEGYWPLFSSAPGGAGLVTGWLQVTGTGADRTIGGEVLWVRPANASARNYQSGFTNDVQAIGSLYQKPRAKTPVLNWTGDGQLILNGAGISHTNSLTLNFNRASVPDLKLQLNIVPGTGLFKGVFTEPGIRKPIQIQGAVMQDSGFGYGYFLNSGESGEIILVPSAP